MRPGVGRRQQALDQRFEDFDVGQVRHEDAERAIGGGRCLAPHVGARADARSTSPCTCRSRTARPTVMRDAPKRDAEFGFAGDPAPAASRPDSMSLRSAS